MYLCCVRYFLVTLTLFLDSRSQGITFTAITIRITLRVTGVLTTTSQQQLSGHHHHPGADLASRNNIPMRGIAINITKDVERDGSDSSDKINYDTGLAPRSEFKADD